ncbi:MAG: hypothetical protein M4579_006321, partial [Chaenotheca gracillima]
SVRKNRHRNGPIVVPDSSRTHFGETLRRQTLQRSPRNARHRRRLPRRLSSLPARIHDNLVSAQNTSSREFIIRRRRWRRGAWIYLSRGDSTSHKPSYYLEWSTFTPRKPTLTLHKGPHKKGPIVGTCDIPMFGHRLKVNIGSRASLWHRLFSRQGTYRVPAQTKVFMTPDKMHHQFPGWKCEMSTKPAQDPHQPDIDSQLSSPITTAAGIKTAAFRWTSAPDGRWILYRAESKSGASGLPSAAPEAALAITDADLLPHIGLSTQEDKKHICVLRITAEDPRSATGRTPAALGQSGRDDDGPWDRVWERTVLLTALAGRLREMKSENRGTVLVVNRDMYETGWAYTR